MSLIGYSPFDHSMLRVFDQMLNEYNQRSLIPYWRNISDDHYLNVGSSVGEIENTQEKFSVSVDVSHFKPDEIKVNLSGNVLTVEGNHEERNGKHGTIQRSFVRKFIVPDDSNLESLRSSLSDYGHLTIEAPKKTQTLTQSRTIPITRG